MLEYKIEKDDFLNHWKISKLKEENYKSAPDTMEAKIDNSWLDEGFSIHQYPCRKEFLSEYKTKEIDFNNDLSMADIYFPFGNPKVERSWFWFLPTYLESWAESQLKVPKSREYEFELKTCGGVKIWVNGKEVIDFRPYTRNIEKTEKFSIKLDKGKHKIKVFFNDLAERDTLYYFSLQSKNKLTIKQLIETENDLSKLKDIENLLESAHFKEDTYKKGEIKLHFSDSFSKTLKLKIEAGGDFIDFIEGAKKTVVLPKDKKEVEIGNVNEYPMGFNHIKISILINNDLKMSKHLTLQVYQKELLFPAADNLDTRKENSLNFIIEHGESIAQKALAMVAKKKELKEAKKILINELEGIEKRKDCSDFYLVPILWLWIKFRGEVFDQNFWNYTEKVIRNFRYWIDEEGNDVMWYFSENHALLFHVSELLAGQIFPEKEFANAGIEGKAHYLKAKERLEEWFQRFFAEGFSEWNSTAYIPIDLIGFFALYELADDKALKKLAKKAIDMTFELIAYNSHHGLMACSHGRSYEKELKGRYVNYTNALSRVSWGVGYLNEATNAQALYCLSDYKPNPELKKYVDWDKAESMIFKNTQGKNNFVDLYLYKNRDYLITSALDFKPAKKGYQEHINQLTIDAEALCWVNHPGENVKIGFGRPSYWAGNGYLPKVAQYKNVQFLLFDIADEHPVDFTHAYFPTYAYDEYLEIENYYFARKDSAFFAITAANKLNLAAAGINQDRELKSAGRKNSWLIRAANRDEFNSFENFIEEISNSFLDIKEQEINFNDPKHGRFKFNWKDNLLLNDEPIEIEHTDPGGKLIIDKKL
ncbi:PA14 domain-containing protein [Halanaerobium saccharolyticum]|uniref:PA14 domain-containing protein n=1 Tax=Halanaerobium saccharolyticum TaxID=43595 RepID=A0A2T5RLK9_9FIRM|nr:PA14 domain-containing protein [Halanaerobium saccharolyticum]PTW00134.1 PA14 domain-containing protein [Halanaerobium saccharolyticum]TDP93605.1 PA14 domain-containing protein [Halanaerobium saccharolyticum]